jgi:lipoprotein signal peptidase
MQLFFIIFILIDQITKAIASRDFFILGLHMYPVKNSALPFGFNFGGPVNFIILLVVYVVAGWFVLRAGENKNFWMGFGKALFLAGAASNLADRIIYGYVRDFIDLNLGFVFNLADIFIVVGLGVILLVPNKKAPQKLESVENLPPLSKT